MKALAAGLRIVSVILMLIACPLLWVPVGAAEAVSCGKDATGEWHCHYSSRTVYGVLAYRTVSTDSHGSRSVVHAGRLAATIAVTITLCAVASMLWVLARRIRARALAHQTLSYTEAELQRVFT